MSTMSSHVGKKIKLIRTTLGLSQAKFCELLDIGIGGLKKYELGSSEPGYSVIEKLANNKATSIYTMWLLTGKTHPQIGQISPGDNLSKHDATISESEFEDQFVDKVAQSLLMFCHLDWFKPNAEKQVDFDDCGKLILKDVKPLLAARYADKQSETKTA